MVDGGLIEAKAEDVRRISNWDRVEYLELDKELDFFYLPPEWGGDPTDPSAMMHETTHVVKATDTWDRVIVSPEGVVQHDVDLSFTEWDGDGTAIVDLDTGVDAGHPDFDYLEPWTGDKVIYSAKWDGCGLKLEIPTLHQATEHTLAALLPVMVMLVLVVEQVLLRVAKWLPWNR